MVVKFPLRGRRFICFKESIAGIVVGTWRRHCRGGEEKEGFLEEVKLLLGEVVLTGRQQPALLHLEEVILGFGSRLPASQGGAP